MQLTNIFSTTLLLLASTSSIATAGLIPMSDGIQVLSNLITIGKKVPQFMPAAMALMRFPECGHSCILNTGSASHCSIVDVNCKCQDPEVLYDQATCFENNCKSKEELDQCWNAFIKTCKPTLKYTPPTTDTIGETK